MILHWIIFAHSLHNSHRSSHFTNFLGHFCSCFALKTSTMVIKILDNQSVTMKCSCKGKFLSESLIFASSNPQYDNRLFIKLLVQYIKIASSEHVVYTNYFCFCFDIQNNLCTQHVLILQFSCTELVIQ